MDLITYTQVDCVAEQQGIGAPPLCEADEIPGDTLNVLPVGQCEGFYVRSPAVPETMEACVAPDVRFYGAYAFIDEETSDERVVVVFEETAGDRPGAKAIYLRGGRIYYVHVDCSFPDGASFVEFMRLADTIIPPEE